MPIFVSFARYIFRIFIPRHDKLTHCCRTFTLTLARLSCFYFRRKRKMDAFFIFHFEWEKKIAVETRTVWKSSSVSVMWTRFNVRPYVVCCQPYLHSVVCSCSIGSICYGFVAYLLYSNCATNPQQIEPVEFQHKRSIASRFWTLWCFVDRNPNDAQSTAQMVHWPAYDVDKQQYLRIGKQLERPSQIYISAGSSCHAVPVQYSFRSDIFSSNDLTFFC